MLILIRFALCLTTLLTLVLITSAPASAQDAKEEKKTAGTISGRVTINGKPAPGITVALRPASNTRVYVKPIKTDDDGRYQLTEVEAGRYLVTTFSFAYTPPLEDATLGEPGKVVIVGEGEEVEGVDLALAPGGVISGRVTDGRGRPVIGLNVQVNRLDDHTPMRSDALRKLYLVGFSSLLRLSTDDRGVYRVCGLPEGNYLVSVDQASGLDRLTIYHPGVSDLRKAAPVKVIAGRETANVDLQFGSLAKTFAASGQIIDAETGQPLTASAWGQPQTAFLVCEPEAIGPNGQSAGYSDGTRSGQADAQGNFEIKNLSPGRYRLRVDRDSRPLFLGQDFGQQSFYANPLYFELTDHDLTGLELKYHRGAVISGFLTIEGETWEDDSWGGMLLATAVTTPEAGTRPAGQVRPMLNHRFAIMNLPPGRVTLRFINSQWTQYSLLRVELNGTEIRNVIESGPDGQLTGGIEIKAGENITGLNVVITPGAGSVQGQVKLTGGTLPAGLRLSVQCRRAGSQSGFYAQAEVDALGRFELKALSPGDYELQLTAPNLTATDPISLPQLQAVKQIVSVQDGAASSVTLTLSLSAKGKEPKP